MGYDPTEARMYKYATKAMSEWLSDSTVSDMVVTQAVSLYENYVPWKWEPCDA